MHKILLVCPVYDKNAGLFPVWLKNAQTLGADNILVVSNSKDGKWLDPYRSEIEVVDITPSLPDKFTRITESLQAARDIFLQGDYTHWLNIEADNIPPADVVSKLITYGADWVSHTYPTGPQNSYPVFGVGCSLLSRRIIEDFKWGEMGEGYSPNNELITWVGQNPGYTTIFLHNFFTVLHIK